MADRTLRLLPRLALLALFLAACAGQEAIPGPAARIGISPSLEQAAADRVRAFAAAEGVPAFDLEPWLDEAGRQAAGAGELALVISGTDPPAGWFATPLWIEGIAVIVHPENPVRSYTLSDLAGLFGGTIHDWVDLEGDAGPVSPVIPLPGDSLRDRFESLVLEGRPITPAARLAASPSDLVNAVLDDPGAIGFMALSQVPDTVRLVRVDGMLPGTATIEGGRYPLWLRLLACAPQEPAGPVHDWLVWLQRPVE